MRSCLIALALLACATSARAQTSRPAVEDVDFTGTWHTTFGPLRITQQGKRIEGVYQQGGPSTLFGTVRGRRLTFSYAEPSAKGDGWFELAATGRAFTGRWRQAGDATWREWTGNRTATPAPRGPFDGLFQTKVGRVRLIQAKGAEVHGTYTYKGSYGRLKGAVQGKTLSFDWREGASTGQGEFVLAAGGQSFTGRWRGGQAGEWLAWSGTHLAPKSRVAWLMVLEAQWETSLVQQEYSFGEMLRSYLRRFPHVQVRHRRFGDAADFARATRELAFLAEPVVLLIASHGEQGRLHVAGGRLDVRVPLGEALNDAPTVELVHFSSCEMMVGDVAAGIQARIVGRRVPISGYSVSVDWSASALLELFYMDLVLGRRLDPSRAVKILKRELRFAGDEGTPGSPLGGSHFRFSP